MFKKEPAVLVLFVFLFSFYSCKTGKSIIKAENLDKVSDSIIIKKLAESNLQFDYLQFDTNVKFINDENSIEGTADVRMKKNEYIWIAVKKLGFEIARVMIRPDSFFVLDRFNRNFSAESSEFLKINYGLPFEFTDLQQLLAGNNLVSGQKLKNRQIYDNDYKIETSGLKYNASYVINNSFYTIFVRIFDDLDKSIEINYSDFKKYNKTEIPHSRKYNFSENSSVNYIIEIYIDDLIIDKQHKIKFEIPSGYEKI